MADNEADSQAGSQNQELGEVPEEELEEKLPEVNIHEETRKVKEIAKEGQSMLSKTADNVSFAYVKLEINEKEIEGLYRALEFYPHLRYLNIKDNKIRDISMVADLHYLVYLDTSSNEIKDISFLENPHIQTYLQFLNLSKNKIKNCPAFNLKRLRKLNLNENLISSLENFDGQNSIVLLEARKNTIKDLNGCSNMTSLKELYLGENQIKTMEGVKNNQNLEVLFLRSNLVSTVSDKFEGLGKLRHVNLRDNQIAKVSEIKKLLDVPSLNSITVHGANPFIEEMKDLKTDLIINLCLDKTTAEIVRGIDRLNKEEIDDEAMGIAIDELKAKLEEERAKREEEEEAKRLEEEAKKAEEDARQAEEAEAKRIEDEARKVEEDARKAEEDARKAEEDRLRKEEEAKNPPPPPEEDKVADEAKEPKKDDKDHDKDAIRKRFRDILEKGKLRKKELKEKLQQELAAKLDPVKAKRSDYRKTKEDEYGELASLREKKQLASITEREEFKTKIHEIKQRIIDLKSAGHEIKKEKWKEQDDFRPYEKEKIDELIKEIEVEKDAQKAEIGDAFDEIINEKVSAQEEVNKKLSENKRQLKKQFTENLESTVKNILERVQGSKDQAKILKTKEKDLKNSIKLIKKDSPEEEALKNLKEELQNIRTDIVKLRTEQKDLRYSKEMTISKIKEEILDGTNELKNMAQDELKKLDTVKSIKEDLGE